MSIKSIFQKFLFLILLKYCWNAEVVESERVIGGQICSVSEHPYVVAIFGSISCGGSLLTLQWVLTAAHCIRNTHLRGDELMVRSGFHLKDADIQVRFVIIAVPHKKFDYQKMSGEDPELRYDIGMMMVDEAFKQTKILRPIKLPKKGYAKECKKATVLGIGVDEIVPYARKLNRPLKCVELRLVNKTICSKTFPFSVLDDSILCTMEDEDGKDACYGDSGGPLVCEGIQIGTVSYGKGCGNAGLSATYTNVESYLDFFKQTINRYKGHERSNAHSKSCRKKIIWSHLWCTVISFLILNQPVHTI